MPSPQAKATMAFQLALFHPNLGAKVFLSQESSFQHMTRTKSWIDLPANPLQHLKIKQQGLNLNGQSHPRTDQN